MGYVVTSEWLAENRDDVVIVDVRFQLDDPDAGRKAYLEAHIPGAVYLDLEKDLSGKKAKHGGSHPLPDIELLAHKLGSIGISDETTVVIYDAANDMFAARLWWLLHYLGHDKAYVLDGGMEAWTGKGYPTTTEIPELKEAAFHPRIRESEAVDMEYVSSLEDDSYLIDSRSRERYLGHKEPLYKKAGHIPGAKNYFWKDVLDADGGWKDSEALQDHFKDLPKDKEIIVSCGSGVSACPNVLSLKMAGFTNVKLYPGSFSDWISYDDNEVEKGEDGE